MGDSLICKHSAPGPRKYRTLGLALVSTALRLSCLPLGTAPTSQNEFPKVRVCVPPPHRVSSQERPTSSSLASPGRLSLQMSKYVINHANSVPPLLAPVHRLLGRAIVIIVFIIAIIKASATTYWLLIMCTNCAKRFLRNASLCIPRTTLT